jgi:hypothetical protein
MPAFGTFISGRWRRQPIAPPVVDWAHPLAVGLVYATYPRSGVLTRNGYATTIGATLSVAQSDTLRASGSILTDLYYIGTGTAWQTLISLAQTTTWPTNMDQVVIGWGVGTANIGSAVRKNSDGWGADLYAQPANGNFQSTEILYTTSSGATCTVYPGSNSYSMWHWGDTFDSGYSRYISVGYSGAVLATYALLFSGVISDAKRLELRANPWQLFKSPSTRKVFFGSSVTSQQYARPISDIAANGWQASTGSDLYAMLDESTPNDADYIYEAE